MCPADSQRLHVPDSSAWNGSTRASFLQGPFDIYTATRHNTESARLRQVHFTRPTVPLSANEIQKAHPHPFLATPSVPLIYDLRYQPSPLLFPSSSLFAGCGYELLHVPLTPERPTQIRLISPEFPWAIGIDPSVEKEGVTCLDVLTALHIALQCPLTDTEWATAGDDKRASLIRARDCRLRTEPAKTLAHTRPTMRSAPGADVPHPRPIQRELLLRRVDWLGPRVAFVGLVKDEAFARSRLIPGGGEPPEMWVVKFQRV
ncbi:hypothetical protein EDB19DRAFT_1723155 [Suillus lakei]|nr:hypothetical protein EDB19DRAFT_1723155 [Suillus lakei]